MFDADAVATYVQTLVVLAGVVVSAVAVIRDRRSADKRAADDAAARADVAARGAAVDFVLRYEVHNRRWWKARLKAIEYLATLSEQDRERVASAWSSRSLNEADKEGVGHVVDWLNHLELVAIAIESESLDRAIYARWQAESLYENWTLAFPLVQAMRETKRGNKSLFEAVQKLAETFKPPTDTPS